MSVGLTNEYRNLLELTRLLCQAIESKDWQQAGTLEQRRQELIHTIDRMNGAALSDTDRLEIAGIIREILEYDALSKPLLQNQMNDLRLAISSTVNERKLGASYL
jgi:hypothetical protein